MLFRSPGPTAPSLRQRPAFWGPHRWPAPRFSPGRSPRWSPRAWEPPSDPCGGLLRIRCVPRSAPPAFISPIFPEITDVKAIIERAKDCCNLIWLENLNLRGAFKPQIMKYISQKYPKLLPLYRDIYSFNRRDYWEWLDQAMRDYAQSKGMEYLTNDDTPKRPFDAPPVIVNYFYHSEIKKNTKK